MSWSISIYLLTLFALWQIQHSIPKGVNKCIPSSFSRASWKVTPFTTLLSHAFIAVLLVSLFFQAEMPASPLSIPVAALALEIWRKLDYLKNAPHEA